MQDGLKLRNIKMYFIILGKGKRKLHKHLNICQKRVLKTHSKNHFRALTGVAQLVGHHFTKQKVAWFES